MVAALLMEVVTHSQGVEWHVIGFLSFCEQMRSSTPATVDEQTQYSQQPATEFSS